MNLSTSTNANGQVNVNDKIYVVTHFSSLINQYISSGHNITFFLVFFQINCYLLRCVSVFEAMSCCQDVT